MRRKNYNGKVVHVRRRYNSLRHFVGENKVYDIGDILCVSTKNNEDYDLVIVADGVSRFNDLYRERVGTDGLTMTLGGTRYLYETAADGRKVLRRIQVLTEANTLYVDGGVSVDVVPPDSVGTDEIKDGSVQMEDLSDEARAAMENQFAADDDVKAALGLG